MWVLLEVKTYLMYSCCMEYRPNVWFSPGKILVHYFDKEKLVGSKLKTSQEYKIIREAYAVALALLGIQKLQGIEYWMQLVDPKESTPDIRTARLEQDTNMLNVHDIEVVTLEEHSSESVEDFLKRTKLSAKKKYPKNTAILCYIERNLYIKSQKEIVDDLSVTKKENDVWILGQIAFTSNTYQLALVNPSAGPVIHFNLDEERWKPAIHLMMTRRSLKRRIWRTDEKCRPF